MSILGELLLLRDRFSSQLHWYDSTGNTAYFKSYFEESYETLQKPIWITEVRFLRLRPSAPS